MAEGLRDALVSINSATTKHPIYKLESRAYRVALFGDGRTDTRRQHVPLGAFFCKLTVFD